MEPKSLRILVLSFYFRPDLSACSFRMTALVKALKTELPPGSQIDVVTTLPNRYSSFTAQAPQVETEDGVSIRRFLTKSHKSGMIDQALTFLSFARQVLEYTQDRQYDIVFATSSRLMTAALASLIARRKKTRLYLDIRDIFVDTIKDVLPGRFVWAMKPVFSVVERWTVKRAGKVNLVSEGFSGYFTKRYPRQKFSFFTNGIDDEFLTAFSSGHVPVPKRSLPLKVVCAGNIGEGQGLHLIIPQLAKQMKGRVHFKIIGDGGRKEVFKRALAQAGVDNVELLPPVERKQLIATYRDADVLFLHLNDYDAFKKVLPSKIFEYAAMGKPVWAGLLGYSADFVRAEVSNSAVFYSCDAESARKVFESLDLKDMARQSFVEKYARANICKLMAGDIIKTVNSKE